MRLESFFPFNFVIAHMIYTIIIIKTFSAVLLCENLKQSVQMRARGRGKKFTADKWSRMNGYNRTRQNNANFLQELSFPKRRTKLFYAKTVKKDLFVFENYHAGIFL